MASEAAAPVAPAAESVAVVPGPAVEVRNDENVSESCSDGKSSANDISKGGLMITSKAELEMDLPPERRVLLVMIAVVQGYTLVGPLQHAFKVAMHIGDTGSLAHVFTQAATFVHWGKFAMTLGQNVLLNGVPPIKRVYIAMAGIALGSAVPPVCVFMLGSTWLGWVFISFGLIGLSLGIFECTFLNVITPLGPLTKSWAIMGFPAAFFIINVFGFLLISAGVPVEGLFWYIVCGVPLGALVFARYVVPEVLVCRCGPRSIAAAGAPGAAADGGADGKPKQEQGVATGCSKTASVWKSCKEWQAWFPQLLPFMLANVVGHFVMEGALPANFNTFNDELVPMLGRTDDGHLMNKHQFFALFFIFVGVGDMASRRVGYCFSLGSYSANMAALFVGLACSVLGMYLTTIGIGAVAWASAFLAFWGQGFNYAVASKYIDRFVLREHNLAAYSFWMFAGSAGAIAGGTMVDVIRYWICHGEVYAHECLAH